MRRTNQKSTPDLILTSDWHLREDTPTCRVDDFQEAQWKKVDQVCVLQEKYDCPVIHAGDLFHHWKPSPWLISKSIERLPKQFFSVAGQHDLPQHSLDLIDKSGVYALYVGGGLKWADDSGSSTYGSWGGEPARFEVEGANARTVGVWHKFVWDGKELPWPGCEEITARKVLKKYHQFDLIVTGDHHKPFTYEYEGRLLVNCGCLTRQVADYADHRPRVWLWYSATNTVEPYYLKIDENAVSREHIDVKQERDKRIDSFISRLSDNVEFGLSFEENLSRFLSANKMRKDITDIIYKAME